MEFPTFCLGYFWEASWRKLGHSTEHEDHEGEEGYVHGDALSVISPMSRRALTVRCRAGACIGPIS
eukprot:2650737-Pyramimonas_sp.AAC.2